MTDSEILHQILFRHKNRALHLLVQFFWPHIVHLMLNELVAVKLILLTHAALHV